MPYISEAKQNGFDDVLWLLDDFVQEMTVLNVMFVIQNRYGALKLYTPIDNGCILNGTTRQSILDMADEIEQETGMIVEQRTISIHEIIRAHEEDRLVEAVGVSTASDIQAINRIVYKDHNIKLDTGPESKFIKYLNGKMTKIMTGPKDHPWVESLEV